MTLVPFPPEQLDTLALRILDVATILRRMSRDSRDYGIPAFELHNQKVEEWLGHIEDWAIEAEGKLTSAINKQRGDLRARTLPTPAPSRAPARPVRTRKKKG